MCASIDHEGQHNETKIPDIEIFLTLAAFKLLLLCFFVYITYKSDMQKLTGDVESYLAINCSIRLIPAGSVLVLLPQKACRLRAVSSENLRCCQLDGSAKFIQDQSDRCTVRSKAL